MIILDEDNKNTVLNLKIGLEIINQAKAAEEMGGKKKDTFLKEILGRK